MISALPRPTATRDWRLYLDALIEGLERASAFVRSVRSAAEFRADARTHDAVLYTIGQVGRFADQLPDAVRVHASGVDWAELRTLATIADPANLVGGYVPFDRLWSGLAYLPVWMAELRALRAAADQLPSGIAATEPEADPLSSTTGTRPSRAGDVHDPGASDLEAPTYEPRTEPLRREEAVRLLRDHAPTLEARFGVRPTALFGSVARDEARVDSDVDVLVEYVRAPGMRSYLGAIDFLESLFRARVDLGTFERLKPRIQPYVRRDMIRVA